jgi:hypothetical protein
MSSVTSVARVSSHRPKLAADFRDGTVVFPAAHPEVGDVEFHNDGDELTVVLGNFTTRTSQTTTTV